MKVVSCPDRCEEPAVVVPESPLARACRRSDLFQVQALLRDKCDPNASNAVGETPLLEAAARGDLNVVALLLGHAGDPKRRCREGLEQANRELQPEMRLLFKVYAERKVDSEEKRALLRALDPGALAQARNHLRIADREFPQSLSPRECLRNAFKREFEATADHAVTLFTDPTRPVLVLRPLSGKATAAVVFLHGLFQSGRMLERLGRELVRDMAHVSFFAPTAPKRATVLGPGPAWCTAAEQFSESQQEILGLIKEVGVATDRVVVCGFSMGGELATFTGLRGPRYAGLLLLGTRGHCQQALGAQLSVLCCHGGKDNIVRAECAKEHCEDLRRLGCDVKYTHFQETGHTICEGMITEVRSWLRERIPATEQHRVLPQSTQSSQGASRSSTREILVGADVLKVGDSRLGMAARAGQEEEVKVLLRQRVDPNGLAWGETPLFSAARNGHVRIACVLMLAKADPTVRLSGVSASDVAPDLATASLLRLAAGENVGAAAQRTAFFALDECQRFLMSWNLNKIGVQMAVSDVLSEADWEAACDRDQSL